MTLSPRVTRRLETARIGAIRVQNEIWRGAASIAAAEARVAWGRRTVYGTGTRVVSVLTRTES